MIWPQLAYLALCLVSLGIIAGRHGQPHPPYNFPLSLAAWAVVLWLQYMGGFYDGLFGNGPG